MAQPLNPPDPQEIPMVFLFGPPGSGKSSLGRRACDVLGLRFVDLPDDSQVESRLEDLVRTRAAECAAVPWAPGRDRQWLTLCRRSGETVGLWAHPLDMQERSGRSESLFTPSKRLTTRGGYGRTGSSCPEYRHLLRSCSVVLRLLGLEEEVAADSLRRLFEEIRVPKESSPTEREGLAWWPQALRRDCLGNRSACEILADAVARYLGHRKAEGVSPRTLSEIWSDLEAAGILVISYQAPRGHAVLECFASLPPMIEFRRRFFESPSLQARFRSNWRAFASFLRQQGEIGSEEAEV